MNSVSPQSEGTNITCQFCSKQTPTDYNFCVECDNQIKCLECGKKTYPGKNYCLACSKPLAVRQDTNQAPNQYERRVKQDGDKYDEFTRFALSDNAVHEIAPFVVNQTMPGLRGQPKSPIPPVLSNSQPIDTSYEDLTSKEGSQPDDKQSEAETKASSEEAQTNENHSSEKNILKDFFQCDGAMLVARENDFRGQYWADQQRHFILLFTKAYKELFNKALPDRELIRTEGVKLKIIDPNNFTTHLNKAVTAFMTQISTGLVLNSAGEREATKIIKLMTDSSAKSGFPYWNRPVSSQSQSSYLTKEERSRVLNWISDPVDLGKLEIRDVSFARDYALLAFWILIHHLKKVNSIKWNEAMLYLTTKYDTTSVSGNAFSKAMNTKEADKFFTKSGEGLYYLSTDGQKLVESWIDGKASVKKQTS